MKILRSVIVDVCLLAATCGSTLYGQSPNHIQTANSAIASAVWVGDTLYLSGMTSSPVTPADRAKGTPAVYGDTKAQSLSALARVEAALKQQGLTMGDIAFMHVYLVADPANGGKMDFAGMNAAFAQFFGTADQPNKPSRTALQVAGLAGPGLLVEFEAVAARTKPAK